VAIGRDVLPLAEFPLAHAAPAFVGFVEHMGPCMSQLDDWMRFVTHLQ
jgi:hypothetical protein